MKRLVAMGQSWIAGTARLRSEVSGAKAGRAVRGCFTVERSPRRGDPTSPRSAVNHVLRLIASIIAIAALLSCLPSASAAARVTVFAAASLADSLQEIAAAYEKQSGERIVFNFAASGLLARQIEEGAPADLFISADEAWADALETKGLIVKETRRDLLANSLVIVTAPDTAAVQSPGDLTHAAVKRVALGDPRTVPAGTYAKVYLEKSGLWPAIKSKVIPCANVRAVLAAVESGNVDAGLVYQTDAAISKNVRVAFAVPMGVGPRIVYPAALVKDAPQHDAAKQFLGYLAGKEAGAVFRRRGFVVLSAAPK
ncbi:MAG: molybdate ABC transporter substrate-binding protein [Limisphaerales bacterium]